VLPVLAFFAFFAFFSQRDAGRSATIIGLGLLLERAFRGALRGRHTLILTLVAAVLAAQPVHADEPVFGFIYTTDLLPKGQTEIEQWMTWRHQKAHGYYDQLENRTEFSYGVTDRFQLSGYLNYNWTRAYHNAVDGKTTPPEQFADFSASPNERFDAARFVGVSVEGIYRVLSPYTDPIGLAFYLEPTIGPDFREIETRVILQKNFLDDRLIVASNLTWAPEIRPPLPKPANVETDINWSFGVSYRFAPSWFFGWEFQNEREMNNWAWWASHNWTNDAYYTGPTLHYGGKRFFVTLTVWEQLPLAKDYANVGVIYQGRDYDVDFEKFRVRLKLGWYF